MKRTSTIPWLLDAATPKARHRQTVVLTLLLQVFVFFHFGLRFHWHIDFVQSVSWWIHTGVVIALNISVWNFLARRRKCWGWTPLQAFVVAMLGAGQAVAPVERGFDEGTPSPSLLEIVFSGGSHETFWVYACAFGELINPGYVVGPLLVAATTALVVIHQRKARRGAYAFRQRQAGVFGMASVGLAAVQYGRPSLVQDWGSPLFMDTMQYRLLRLTFMSALLALGVLCIAVAIAAMTFLRSPLRDPLHGSQACRRADVSLRSRWVDGGPPEDVSQTDGGARFGRSSADRGHDERCCVQSVVALGRVLG